MAEITTNTNISVAMEDWDQVGSGLISLEASVTIYPGMACYILKSGGVWGVKLAGGSAWTALTDAIGVVDGYSLVMAKPGQPIVLGADVQFGNLIVTEPTASSTIYLSNVNRGGLATAAAVTSAKPIGRIIGKANSEKNLTRLWSVAY